VRHWSQLKHAREWMIATMGGTICDPSDIRISQLFLAKRGCNLLPWSRPGSKL